MKESFVKCRCNESRVNLSYLKQYSIQVADVLLYASTYSNLFVAVKLDLAIFSISWEEENYQWWECWTIHSFPVAVYKPDFANMTWRSRNGGTNPLLKKGITMKKIKIFFFVHYSSHRLEKVY